MSRLGQKLIKTRFVSQEEKLFSCYTELRTVFMEALIKNIIIYKYIYISTGFPLKSILIAIPSI